MTVQSQIDILIEQADKLRPLHEDDPLKMPLPAIVERINALRAAQAAPGFVDADDVPVKRAPGRPKARIEGADA